MISFPFSSVLRRRRKKILHQAPRRSWQLRWSRDGSASICCLWVGLMDTFVLSAVCRVNASLLHSNSVYLCYSISWRCHTSVFIFPVFCLNTIKDNVSCFHWFDTKFKSLCGWNPGTTRDPSCKQLSVAILCTRCRGFLTTWAVDYATCESAHSCDKALFLEVVCMFDARMCMCLMVGVCRATLPECWCVTLQHCLAYPVKLFPSSLFFIVIRLSLPSDLLILALYNAPFCCHLSSICSFIFHILPSFIQNNYPGCSDLTAWFLSHICSNLRRPEIIYHFIFTCV